LGAAAHPAAYYCKTLTTGGYNTWYLPAKAELNTLYSNNSATPFATANGFVGNRYWSSTERNGFNVWDQYFNGGYQGNDSKNGAYYVRATRRSTI
jgi:trehalose/maltose hydrolase-like predicted phosphorylase